MPSKRRALIIITFLPLDMEMFNWGLVAVFSSPPPPQRRRRQPQMRRVLWLLLLPPPPLTNSLSGDNTLFFAIERGCPIPAHCLSSHVVIRCREGELMSTSF